MLAQRKIIDAGRLDTSSKKVSTVPDIVGWILRDPLLASGKAGIDLQVGTPQLASSETIRLLFSYRQE
jgi:hypothetical protein